MLFIRRIKTLKQKPLKKREKRKRIIKTLKNNENKHFDDFFYSSNQHNKINELKYA